LRKAIDEVGRLTYFLNKKEGVSCPQTPDGPNGGQESAISSVS
jgi:hypothetical protein